MSAKASGSDAQSNGNANQRGHHDGSAGRAFTVEQKAAVLRVRECSPTAFYDILGLEEVKKTCTDSEIKKAYRKQSLLTHPDKNGYEGADEAFKMISRAFQILSDPDKKAKFDRFGHDPDSRFQSAPSASPFSGRTSARGAPPGFGGPFGGGGSFFEEEISPEDLFRQFFGGGGMGGPFGFDTGPGFVFNMGGGPGFRVHQFGGGRPQRRPGAAGAEQAPQSLGSMISSLLPLLILFIFPLLSSLFGGSTSAPSISLNQRPPYTASHKSSRLGVTYFVNPAEVQGYKKANDWRNLDRTAETHYMHALNDACEMENRQQQNLFYEAQGWFSNDEVKMERARNMEKRSCKELDKMRKLW